MATINDPSVSSGASGVSVESDPVYDLVSVLYHALQGAETCATYIADAEAQGDEELASFFQEIHDAEQARAHKARELLIPRLRGETEMSQTSEGGSEELENAAE
jgi:hypothetical protein